MTDRLTYGPWQRALFVVVGLTVLALGAAIWILSTSRDAPVVVSAVACAVGGVMIIVNAFVTAMEFGSDGFRVRGLWRRAWSWSDVERFYVYETRGVQLVGYVPAATYKSAHVMARIVAALNLGTYALPTFGMGASSQARLMNEWLRRHG